MSGRSEPMTLNRKLAICVATLMLAVPATSQTSWEVPDLNHTFVETSWGYVRSDYVPPAAGTHGIFFMEGYMGASTPQNGLDYSDPVAPQPTHPTHYVRMPDGALMAVTVHSGFSGLPLEENGFSLVMASVRGTACSGGTFDLFDTTHREDGARLIDWLGTHSYEGALGAGVENTFEEKVALFGASYSGITALLVASEQPENLGAVSANMVIGDMYRDIAYPGGVPNIAFPGLWTLGLRPAQDVLGTLGGAMEIDEICLQNQAMHNARYPTDHAGFGMYTRRTDDTMYRARSPAEFAHKINVPIVLGQSFQDEQTGPRGGYTVWPELHPDPVFNPCYDGWWGTEPTMIEPRNMILTNGVHGTSTDNGLYYALPWFKYWMKGDGSGYGEGLGYCDMFDDTVRVHWEKKSGFVDPSASGPAGYTHNGTNLAAITGYDAFPIPGTDWQAWGLCGDGTIAAACEDTSARSYLHGGQRVGSWNYGSGGRAHEGSEFTQPSGPDLLRYRSDAFAEDLTVLGPMTMRFAASSSAPDTEFFVTVADVAPNGDVTYLQKGMLKASHRLVDPERTWYEDGEIIRVSHMHTAEATSNMVTPGEVVDYVMDVHPLGHTFRAGHELQVQIHSPPLNDGRWGYGPLTGASANTIHSASLTLPVIPTVDVGDYLGCGIPDGYRCVPASHNNGF